MQNNHKPICTIYFHYGSFYQQYIYWLIADILSILYYVDHSSHGVYVSEVATTFSAPEEEINDAALMNAYINGISNSSLSAGVHSTGVLN